jgi:hypothetical protein
MEGERAFEAVTAEGPRGSVIVPLPFDPHEAWGRKAKHHVGGTIDGAKFRAEAASGVLTLGPMWRRDCGVEAGRNVRVVVWPEGPQRAALDPDVAAALAGEPEAAAFFDGLAQFYRKAWLTWIGGAKSRPDERARRIAGMVVALKAGKKARD